MPPKQEQIIHQSVLEQKSIDTPHILYASHPVITSEDAKEIKSISLPEAAKLANMKVWTDAQILVDKGVSERIQHTGRSITDAEFEVIKQQISVNSENLVLCEMNSSVGQGVYSTNTTIKKSTAVGIYVGRYSFFEEEKNEGNTYSSTIFNADEDIKIVVDAKEYGNIMRCFQHLPNASPVTGSEKEVTLKDYSFNSKNIREQIATANVKEQVVNYKGVPFLLYHAKEDIPPGTQLGFDYGIKYWAMQNKSPSLFDKNGKIVNPSEYTVKKPVTYVVPSTVSGMDHNLYRLGKNL